MALTADGGRRLWAATAHLHQKRGPRFPESLEGAARRAEAAANNATIRSTAIIRNHRMAGISLNPDADYRYTAPAGEHGRAAEEMRYRPEARSDGSSGEADLA